MFKPKRPKKAEKPFTIQDLYSELHPTEQEEAELFFNRYIYFIESIVIRLDSQGEDRCRSSQNQTP